MVPMILGGQLPGKVGSRWGRLPNNGSLKHSSLAQSVERMTVNHDVVGSSPTGGAICTFSSVGRATDS